ncbi:MAG: alpha-2-macroglobulin, partial [Calditrichia bacterium]|nr:alpha-2-macroglobulin [Calditrichia bacterium]
MPFEAPGRWLNYSKFDVGGVHGASNPKKINAYLFSDRGIYRPGDEFNIGMIIKSGDWDKSIAGTPLEATVIDARGLEIHKKKFKLPESGFEELQYQTENTSPTGTYQVNLYTIRRGRRNLNIGSVTIKIEEFLPDRLNITSMFPGVKNLAWVSPKNLKATVTLRNLFGLPARGNRIVAQISLSPGRMWFKPYRDFQFSDPLTLEKYYSETLPEQLTDEDGKAIFDLNLERFEAATYSLNFMANGFEKEGGRNVTTGSGILVSPLKYLLGTKANGDLSYIYKDSERLLKVIAINPQLKKIAVSDIQFELNEIQQVSVLTKMPNGTYAYKSVEKKVPVSTENKNIPALGLDYVLPTDKPGEYEMIIKNIDGIQFSRVAFSVVGMGNLTRSLDKTAELEIKLNKTDYEPGEMIEVYVKAPYKGSGLITIERDKIYSYQWFKAPSNSFIKKILLPADLEGNGYINVSFVRAADSKEIYMSPLSYGIAPFSVSKKNRMNKISIDIPAEARSGNAFPIKYKTDKPGKMVVFAIDEGILQVANYSTPKPLAHFFKKRALEVQTSQLMDLILPEFSLYQLKSAMGGGMDYEMGADELSKNLNPFKRKQQKPVVFWSGIIDSDREERTLEYTVPDYFNGTLRVMAVVVSDDAIGTFEEKAIVKNPYIISPNIPMFAAPGDSFQVSVTVTNGLAGSGKNATVNLDVTTTPHLKITNAKRKLLIDEDGDTTLTFQVKANNLPGAAALNFKASGNNETTKLASYLSVRPASPYHTKIITGVLKDDDVEVKTPRQLYKEFRVLNTSVSFLPLGLSKGLVTYLDRFPHGCTEQVVSQAFPYLYLKDVNGFGVSDSQASEKVKYALKVLQARQNYEGKFGIWAANSFTSDFITVYGTHFITECKKAGYYVSDRLYDEAINA